MRINFNIVSILPGLIFSIGMQAQNYHAIEGSPFAGSLDIANNPASIVNTPYAWDITVFSLQLKNSTNAVTIKNYSLLSRIDSSKYIVNAGNFRRYASFNFNIHLLNARLALNRREAIAFGANLRGYGIGSSSSFNYSDSLHSLNNFFSINQGNNPYSGNVVSSTWIELFATYARTIRDDETGRLNAGVTLKAMRGISGGFVQLQSGSVESSSSGSQVVYTLARGSARYGYSSNYDTWQKNRSTGQNLKNFLSDSRGGFALDIGAEYLVKSQAVPNYYDEDNYYEYEWKIGVSLLDIGQNTYKYGTQSRLASNPKSSAADSTLNTKFSSGINSLADFNDSLGTLVNNFQPLGGGIFKIRNPARLVINVDRPLQDHFSVNANLSINLMGSSSGKSLNVQETNLLALTPRWETRQWGVYLPVQYTTEGRLMVGGAFKAGPLLIGVHNWGNVFARNKMQNGGGYIALVIRAKNSFPIREDKRYSCPKEYK